MKNCYDNSQIGQYQKCPFSYYLQYVEGIKKREDVAVNQGSDIHALLEEHYTKKTVTTKDEVYKFILEEYAKFYKEQDVFEIFSVEKPIKFDIKGFHFIVKCDTIVKLNGNTFGLEHKTTAKDVDDKYFAKFDQCGQMKAQTYSIKKEFGVCDGVIVNGISIKELKRKPTSAKYTAWKQFGDMFVAVTFDRYFVNHPESKLIEWEHNTFGYTVKIAVSKKNNDWLKATSSMGGMICNMCKYKELCKFSTVGKIDESVLAMYYERCDPYEYLKEKKDV